MTRITAALLLMAVQASAAGPVQMTLTPRAITEAIAVGQSRIERERNLFHEPYRHFVKRPPVDYVDVVTPFRRIVLAAQARAQAGDRGFMQRDGLALLTDPPEIELWVEFTFHPLNTYVGVPVYDIVLLDRRGSRMPALGLDRRPRHGARLEGTPLPIPVPGGLRLPETSDPLVGGTIVARFNGRMLDPAAAYDVLVEEGEKELARVRVELGRLR